MSFGKAEGWVHNPWALDEEESRTIIKRALELGVNFFDTANLTPGRRKSYVINLKSAKKPATRIS